MIVVTGNISNHGLLKVFATNLAAIIESLEQASLVEVRADELVIHDDQ